MALDRTERTHDAWFLGGLLLLVLTLLWPAWKQPDGFWYAPGAEFSDLTVTFWPNMWFLRQTVRQSGQIPLWRPLIMGGSPFLGNPQSALFYPPTWLFLVLPTTLTFHLLLVLHLFGAGASMYGLMRWSYRRSPPAAFVAGLSYALSPKLIAHVGAGHVGFSYAYAWPPLALWLLRGVLLRGRDRSGLHWALGCGAVLAMAFLTHAGVAFYTALLLAAYALYRLLVLWRASGARPALAMAGRLALVPLALIGVGAVQILPTLELMGAMTRATLTLSDAARDSLPWRYLIGYLIADRGGYHEWMTYLGLIPLGLSGLALWRGRERERWFWAVTATLGLLYSLGTNAPLYPLVYRLLPGLGWVRVPPRALFLVIVSVSLLAAQGFDALFGAWSSRGRRWSTLFAVAGLLLFGGLGLGFWLLLGAGMPAGVASFALVGAAAMLVLLSIHHPRVPRVLCQGALAGILLLDLWPVARSLLALRVAASVFDEGIEAALYLSAQPGAFRVYSPSYSVRQHVGARLGLEQLDGVDPAQLRWVAQFMGLAGGYPLEGYGVTIPSFPQGTDVRTALKDAIPDAALLGLLNARFVVAEFPIDAPGLQLQARAGTSYIYGNDRCLPRAFLLGMVQPVASWQEAQERLSAGFDPAMGALVEGGDTLSGSPGYRPARVSSYAPNRIVVEADTAQPALLVLSEVWYPGWEVTVDGRRQPAYRVDGVVRGVYLDPGTHVVTWRYRPAVLRWGAWISLAALAAWAAWSMRWHR